MKVVHLSHPDHTYPDAVEAVCITLSKEFRLHSTCFLPEPVQGTGKLMLFFEPKSKLRVVPLKLKEEPDAE